MDNHLTPKKIQRLIHLAEDKSYTRSHQFLLHNDVDKSMPSSDLQANGNKSSVNMESSSGILDLDRVEAFGDSAHGNESFGKSTAFSAREMSGRSTGVDDFGNTTPRVRHSLALESITSQMNKQTNEVQDLIRHSISNTTTYSFQSKRDLTADEASLVMREAPLPILTTVTQTIFPDSVNNSSVSSVGAYFQNRCPEFMKMLEKTESPDRYNSMPSISEVSIQAHQDPHMTQKYTDESLDCVPVRQSRTEKPEQLNFNNPNAAKNNASQNFLSAKSKFEKSNEPYIRALEDTYSSNSNAPESIYNMPQKLVPVASSSFASQKPFKAAPSKINTDIFIRNMQQSLQMVTHDTEGSACPSENSLSISKIADYLGKESNISVTGILKYNNKKKTLFKKQPLSELHMNLQENKKNEEVPVTSLRESRKTDTASSTGTINTVISLNKLHISENTVPEIVITNDTNKDMIEEYNSRKRATRSKSPSSRSHSTLSTVQENCTSFKSGDSPLHTSKSDVNNTHVPSPNIEYRELDKSVDWHEVLQQKRQTQESLAKEQWADILTTPTNGFVGVRCPVNITITTLSDSWLTAKIKFDNLPDDGKDITIEMPRTLFLLSPGKSETFTFHITSFVEMNTTLSYTIFLKDSSIDSDTVQKGSLPLNIKMPMIQSMSSDGVNKVTYPPIPEKSALVKSFVLISDCSVDLELDLTIVEGDSMFAIKSVTEIKKTDVNKVLVEGHGTLEEGQHGKGKGKSKGLNKQLCRLSSGNAIRVAIKFNAPQLSEQQIEEHVVTFTGAVNVNLIGVNSLLRKVDLVGIVGSVKLAIKIPENKLQLTKEPATIPVYNMGSVKGVWVVSTLTESCLFKVTPSQFELRPGAIKQITLCYTGPEDTVSEATLTFVEHFSGNTSTLQILGGSDMPKSFPIKTNFNKLSFVRTGRKELSLKNYTDKKVHIICRITGEGFSIDLPGMEAKGASYCLAFGPQECRPLHIMFNPVTSNPYSASLHLVYDRNSDFCRTVRLYGCGSGEIMRWSDLVTYGDTALVRAVSRQPISLQLYNKSPAPAFVCARVHFNLQDTSVSSTARLVDGNRVVGGRSRHTITLHVDWPRIERRARDASAAALATITVLTGAELTRRRILRVLRDESSGVLDLSPLDEHQKVLASQFEGEDPNMDNLLADFHEGKTSLNELVSGLHELTAQIVLPQDLADENTIIITDDTVVEHHTLCD